jgi:hypothetical protein
MGPDKLVLHFKKLRLADYGHFQTVTDSKLTEDAVDVILDGLLGQIQMSSNLFIG